VTTIAFVQARSNVIERTKFGEKRAVQYRPVYTSRAGGDLLPLAWDGDDSRWFDTFEEAERVVLTYNDGPGDDVRSATWNGTLLCWDVEYFDRYCAHVPDREDFHSDG